jgi:hypothetical protein
LAKSASSRDQHAGRKRQKRRQANQHHLNLPRTRRV